VRGEVGMDEIHVKKYGERMNSPKAMRRNLFLEIQPFDGEISHTISLIQNVRAFWEFESPNLSPWYKYQPCKYCIARSKYEHMKFKEGWVWNRRYCMRHYVLEHLDDISNYDDDILSNRVVDLYISMSKIILLTGSNNYKYNIQIGKEYAIVSVNYKGSKYVFRYNNHTNALPYASSYIFLLFVVYYVIEHLLDFLKEIKRAKRFNCWHIANVYINSELFLPVCNE
jgi:hypothetical protein